MGGVSPECESGISGLTKDGNFQYRNTSLINQCYMRYQNSMGKSLVSCRQWEYENFCAQYNFGRICLVSTGFVEIPFCTPAKCTIEADFGYILSKFFSSASSSINCDVKQTESVLVPALVSTIVILLLSVFLVFAVRPPKHIRESTKLIKAQASLTSLASSSSSSL